MTAELNIDKFEDFIAQYPIFEYRILNTGDLSVEERVRIVCQQECERYGSTWACPLPSGVNVTSPACTIRSVPLSL